METLKWIIIIVCSIGTLIFNMTIIDSLLIPDPCFYHTNEMNPLLSLFYSSSGYHPEPNIFNIVFILIIGGVIGKWIFKLISKFL